MRGERAKESRGSFPRRARRNKNQLEVDLATQDACEADDPRAKQDHCRGFRSRTLCEIGPEETNRAAARIASWKGSRGAIDRKSTRLNSSHLGISYAVF